MPDSPVPRNLPTPTWPRPSLPSPAAEEAGGDLDAQLLQDLERMRAKSQQQQQPGQARGAASHSISQAAAEPQPGAFGGVKELVDKVGKGTVGAVICSLEWPTLCIKQ
jgi:hypothetical protein